MGMVTDAALRIAEIHDSNAKLADRLQTRFKLRSIDALTLAAEMLQVKALDEPDGGRARWCEFCAGKPGVPCAVCGYTPEAVAR